MLSFRNVTDINIEQLLKPLSGQSEEYARELLDSFLEFSRENPECELAVSLDSDCLLLRVFDGGEYYFLAPFMLSESAGFSSAVRAIAAYAVKEEIPLVFSDVDAEMLSLMSEIFCFTESELLDDGVYRVEVKNELDMLDNVPSLQKDGVLLTKLGKSDQIDYKRLATDVETGRYWGYDYLADEPNPDDCYFYDVAVSEFERCISLSLAVRLGDTFIGEAVIQSFDFMGGAEIAVRLLPEYRGRGLGSTALELLIDAARAIGLLTIRARVLPENAASLRLFSKYMKNEGFDVGAARFSLVL